MRITPGTISRTICLVLALINQLLAILGKDSLPFTNDGIYQCVSVIFTVCTSIVTWWKNNSFTKEARLGDEVMRTEKLKN